MACKEVVLFFVPQAIVNNLLCHFRFQIFMVFIHEYICLSIKTLQDLLKPRMHLFFYLQSINIFRRRLKLITLYNSVKIKVEQIYCTFYTIYTKPLFSRKKVIAWVNMYLLLLNH